MKTIYLACFLPEEFRRRHQDEMENDRVINKMPDTYPNRFGHHMTVKFRPSEADCREIQALFGLPITLTIIGGVAAEVLAVVIDKERLLSDYGLVVANDIAHITIATMEGVKPFKSNEVLSRGDWLSREPHSIPSTLGAWNVSEEFPQGAIDYTQMVVDGVSIPPRPDLIHRSWKAKK